MSNKQCSKRKDNKPQSVTYADTDPTQSTVKTSKPHTPDKAIVLEIKEHGKRDTDVQIDLSNVSYDTKDNCKSYDDIKLLISEIVPWSISNHLYKLVYDAIRTKTNALPEMDEEEFHDLGTAINEFIREKLKTGKS